LGPQGFTEKKGEEFCNPEKGGGWAPGEEHSGLKTGGKKTALDFVVQRVKKGPKNSTRQQGVL